MGIKIQIPSRGSLKIEHVNSACKNLDIHSEFSKVDIPLDENRSYSIEAHASFGCVDIGGKANVTNRDSGIGSESIKIKLDSGSGGGIDIQYNFGYMMYPKAKKFKRRIKSRDFSGFFCSRYSGLRTKKTCYLCRSKFWCGSSVGRAMD